MYNISSQYVKKIKIFILGVILGGALGSGGLDCGQYHILTALAMAWRTCVRILVMIGPIGWEEFDDRQTDDKQTTDRRQTDRQIESPVPYDTFACFAGLIMMMMAIILLVIMIFNDDNNNDDNN